MFEQYVHVIVDFVRAHHSWAAPVIFGLAFLESIAFFSLLIPAWGALILLGGLIAASGIPFIPVLIAAAIGAALGDWISYSIGFHFKDRIAHWWPLSSHPDLLPRGHAFMDKWGVLGIFIGRFFGPLRASVPLIAGIVEMNYWLFQAANFASAFVWAYVLLAFGDFGVGLVKWFI